MTGEDRGATIISKPASEAMAPWPMWAFTTADCSGGRLGRLFSKTRLLLVEKAEQCPPPLSNFNFLLIFVTYTYTVHTYIHAYIRNLPLLSLFPHVLHM